MEKSENRKKNLHKNQRNDENPRSGIQEDTTIRIEDAYKIYKRGKIEVVALRGMNCEFKRGELTVIMGPSGCGKTTLLNMIGGLDRLSSGTIYVNQKDITELSDNALEEYRRDNIGFVFQFSSLIPELSAEENVLLPIKLASKLNEKKRNFVNTLFKLVGLQERKTHRPDELSGGERQRVGVAAALSNNPEIILCDEPTGELDSTTKVKIMDLLHKIVEMYPNKTLVVVTHDPELKKIADKLYYIRDGQISHQMSDKELYDEMAKVETGEHDYQKSFRRRGKKQALLELKEIEHYIKDKIDKLENSQ